MDSKPTFEIFLVSVPGLESLLCAEAVEKGFKKPKIQSGGVTVRGGWVDVWRANLEMRGASKVLARIGSFPASHLAQLDKQSRRFAWGDVFRSDVPIRIEAFCKKSRIYHSGAAQERLSKAIAQEFGAPVQDDADLVLKARIFKNQCTLSIDTSGEGLHKRGHKQAVNIAPMRETMAAMVLRFCGYKGKEPVVDPMCGSGTFVIEAAEIARRLNPGRSRSFAFENLATFDGDQWEELRARQNLADTDIRFYGSDKDPGAVRMSLENAKRAGVEDHTIFAEQDLSDLSAPNGPRGLLIANPPYGTRIGENGKVAKIYKTLGKTVKQNFAGWRFGLVTNSDALAKATGVRFDKISDPISHGGIKVKVYATD
ncbi:N-6 DNA methylase [Magnetovibrio sp. PR-2]|uniref:THUMP domain-containing class I SAM-dependent RNA methyltransferase n=1 Tax=Magnetovibrio sp. PR-2 TaxID=3120356 RepID=UPI002FCE1C37